MKPITVEIQPDMINLSEGLSDTFGQFEQEAAAVAVVKFCQIIGVWMPFTKYQIKRVFFGSNPPSGFDNFDLYFGLLVERGHILPCGDAFEVSQIFVRRCFQGHATPASLGI